MDCGLFCAECQDLYLRACEHNDQAAWMELRVRAMRAFLQFLDKQVGAMLVSSQKKRLAEHAIAVMRRRARPNTTLANALRDARGVLARLIVRVLIHAQPYGAQDRETRLREFVGESTHAARVRKEIAVAAVSDLNVLIIGETGTGKELVAQAIHSCSPRAARGLICYNCAGTSTDLVASELFGHLCGAFTGATRDRLGRVEEAHESDLLLDELEAMPVDHQVKLLRVVEDGKLLPVGGSEKDIRRVAVRYLAATNRAPHCLIGEGKLREDLYYRLSGREIALPPLRDRAEDIPLLAQHFLQREADSLTRDAVKALQAYHWPGNVRQLENVLQNAKETAFFRGKKWIGPEDIATAYDRQVEKTGQSLLLREPATVSSPLRQKDGPTSKDEGYRLPTLADVERDAIRQALRATEGKVCLAAEKLGIHRGTLRRKLREHGIDAV